MTNSQTSTPKFHLIIQTNSPGEIATWVIPFITRFKQKEPTSFITVCLAPCQYATGNEKEVMEQTTLINTILNPKQTLSFIIGQYPLPKQASKGAVLCLGGDPFYSQLLGLRLGFPSSIYTEHTKKPGLLFKHIFTKHQHGDLMKERVEHFTESRDTCLRKNKLDDHNYLLLSLGSRPQHFKAFSKLCAPMIQTFLSINRNAHIIVSIAPTINKETEKIVHQLYNNPRIHIIRGNSLELMACASLLVSLPGSNTAEAMYMNLPMFTIAPLNFPELIILDGIGGLVHNIPILGSIIKKLFIYLAKRKTRYISLPNRIANTIITPQVLDIIQPETLGSDIADLFSDTDQLASIKNALIDIKPTTNPCLTIINTLINNKSAEV